MSSAFREGSKDQAGMRAAIKHVMTRLKESGPKGPLGKAQRAVELMAKDLIKKACPMIIALVSSQPMAESPPK